MLVELNGVQFNLKDLIAFHASDAGVIGQKHVEGVYINLILRGAPTALKAACDSEKQREKAMEVLTRLWKAYHRARKIISVTA